MANEKPSKFNSKKILFKSLELAIYALVIWFIYDKLGGSLARIDVWSEINYGLLILAVFVYMGHTFWNALNWHYMIKASGEDVTVISQVEVYLKSYLLRYVPGNIVGILARAIYNKQYNVPMAKSLWGWFWENIVYLALGLLLGSIALFSVGQDIFDRLEIGSEPDLLFQGLIVAVFVLTLFVILDNRVLKSLFNKFLLPKLSEKSRREFQLLDISMKDRLILLLRYAIAWGIYSISFYFILKAVGVESNYVAAISANAMAWALGYMSVITPSGAGVRETVMIFLLTASVGLSGSASVIIAVLARIVFISGEVLGFLAFFVTKFLVERLPNGRAK
ncbi:MAG: lysylphosphatidylglycerol synthase transmembrane domain-containing protein [Candidatus Dojkabacteria bacterium]|nr:MAG: lysylphosphatidylglycerol synthase transmembrane domain-containing protein [Candidatus Dojkabacteria bacterium]